QCDAHNVHRWQHTAALTAPGDCAGIQAFVNDTRPEHPVQFIGDYLVQASLNVAVSAAERVVRRWTR
ncbi:MAG TPA: hypothetical protein VFY31_06580, partial [Macromonas sp.]|nr:hypothetical protein [Macromonas sp.]